MTRNSPNCTATAQVIKLKWSCYKISTLLLHFSWCRYVDLSEICIINFECENAKSMLFGNISLLSQFALLVWVVVVVAESEYLMLNSQTT